LLEKDEKLTMAAAAVVVEEEGRMMCSIVAGQSSPLEIRADNSTV
jgi:hypothetical protein